MNEEEYLSMDSEMEDSAATSAAAFLSAVAKTLRDAPIDKRYDVELTVTERDDE